MKVADIFRSKRVISFEIYPPKRVDSESEINCIAENLKKFSPDFISVTCGAGGKGDGNKTIEIASAIKHVHGIESVVHLPGANLAKRDVLGILGELRDHGIENIMALRGDIDPGNPPKGEFRYASELISFIKGNGDFNILAGCYPEGHVESASIIEDIRNLKIKVDAGVDQLVTQLFFDNEYFYSFRERAAIAGINVPIAAGIMPVVNKKQVERIVRLCGVSLPKKYLSILDRYGDNPVAMRDAGIAYAVDQIVDLIAHGVDGIHLYILNNTYVASRICEAIDSLLAA